MARIVLTGGAGFIGTHIIVEAIAQSHDVLVIDNFVNSSPKALDAAKQIVAADFNFLKADLCDFEKIDEAFSSFKPDFVIHLAGLKAVGESVEKPLMYYEQNILSTLSLLKAMDNCGCKTIIFSSSATVYGEPQYLPLDENHPVGPTNPYGKTKLFIEEILKDWVNTDRDAKAICLRYFNPVGAHDSGLIGEDPQGIPNNLFPLVAQVASGKKEYLSVFGNDYDTPDGTGVRDYIHVCDLAEAHIAAVDNSQNLEGWEAINLGTENGFSVLEIKDTYKKMSNRDIPSKIMPRREGDVGSCWSTSAKAKTLLRWEAKRDLEDMCQSSWKFHGQHPDGYDEE